MRSAPSQTGVRIGTGDSVQKSHVCECVRKYVRIYRTVCTYILHRMYVYTAPYVRIYCTVCTYILHRMYVYTAPYVRIYCTVCTYILHRMYVYIALAPNSYSELTIRIYSKHKQGNAAC